MPDGASSVLHRTDKSPSEGTPLEAFRHGRGETFDDAFATLFRQHQQRVCGWILRIVRDRSTAEDLTVETFWRICRAHARFDPARGFEAWARSIATHVALDWMRKQRPETALDAELPALRTGDPGVSAEIRRRVALAFSRLPPKLRIAAILGVIEDLPHKEIAAVLGISPAAVKVRVFRALRLLRRDLTEQGITP